MNILENYRQYTKPLTVLLLFWFAHLVLAFPATPLANLIPVSFGGSALTALSLSFILAARWLFVERLLGGRDKAYVVHRWLGYASFVGIAVHWVLATEGVHKLIPSLGDFAADIATPVTIAFLGLASLSAIKQIPYHLWIWTHRLLGPLYVLLVAHSFFTPIPFSIDSLVWWFLCLISIIGIVAWLSSLLRLFIQNKPYEVISKSDENNNLDIRLKPLGKAHKWLPGQFANLTPRVRGFEEAHPFSIASASNGTGEIRFIIRKLGDFSAALPKVINVGDTVTLSKPAGRFLPKVRSSTKPQVWLAGGVGITPFLAALDAFNEQSPNTTIFYCIKDEKSAIDLQAIQDLSKKMSNLTVVVLNSEHGNLFTKQSFEENLSTHFKTADLFICGAPSLKSVASESFMQWSKTGKIFHEYFDFRAAIDFNDL